MTGRMPAYFRLRVGSQILALLLVITALMQLLELLDVTTDVLKRNQGLIGVLYYGALRLPADLVTALPPAALLGTLLALSSMARNLEIVTMRTAGISTMRLLGYLLPVGLVVALAQFALSEAVLPRADNQLKEWWSASAPLDDAHARLWAHTNGGTVSMDSISPDGTHLEGVRLYARDGEGLLSDRVVASEAIWNGNAWLLKGVTDIRLEKDEVVRTLVAEREWDTNLRPDDVLRLDVDRPNLSTIMLSEVLAGTRAGALPQRYYETVLYRSFAAPLGIFVMLLLALPTACVLPRLSSGTRVTGTALVLGLGYLLCDGMMAVLGTNSRWPPLITALASPTLFAAIGFWQIHAAERT